MPNRIDGDFGITGDSVNALIGLLKQSRLGQGISSAIDDYGQLSEAYPNFNKFAGSLRDNIDKHIPTQQDFESPEAMSEWSQSAALNAPMALGAGATDDIMSIVNRYIGGPEKAKYPGVDPRNYLGDAPIMPGMGTGSRTDVAVGGAIPNGFNRAIGGRDMPANMPAQNRNMLSDLTYSGNRNR
ncbi:MAG: hypothetical protein WC465_04880 [Patescibacteria group bacterium]